MSRRRALENEQGCKQLRLSLEGSPASLFPLPGSEEARRMTATSGRSCLELSRKSGPLGCLVKMLLASSAWASTMRYLTWKPKATKHNHLLFRLVPSEPRTGGTEYSLWRTPSGSDGEGGVMEMRLGTTGRYKLRDHVHPINAHMWPTPKNCPSGPDYARVNRQGSGGDDLATAVARTMFPSPAARDWKSGLGRKDNGHTPQLPEVVGGQLNPTWVEWLMGFPAGWTELRD